MAGAALERVRLVTASPRSFCERTCIMAPGTLLKYKVTWPAITSINACPPPLYGTCTMLIFACDLKNSADSCVVLPAPADA